VAGPVLLYDGDCGFCTWTATKGQRLLPADVTIQAWQRADLSALNVTREAATRAVQWIAPGKPPLAGYRAISAWLVASGMPWSLAGRVMRIPPVSWIADGCYRVVAKERHRIPGPWRATRGCVTRGTGGRPW